MRSLSCIAVPLLALACGCGGGPGGSSQASAISGSGGSGGTSGSGGSGGGALHAFHVTVAFTDDGQGIAISTQNGAVNHIDPATVTGKKVWWATTPAGEPASSATPIDFGYSVLGADLTATYQTPAHYADGPWEMSLFVSVAGGNPMDGPLSSDLGAFDNSPPPAGQPPVTGSSVRVTLQGADLSITLGNDYFVQF